MPKFRKKPVVIDARHHLGDREGGHEIATWCHGVCEKNAGDDEVSYVIRILTLEGEMTASAGDWIIKGVNGEFYPCKPDIFEKTYEAVEE
jgi:hypothetical protein